MELPADILNRLDRLVHPHTKLHLRVKVNGLFNPPDQWRTTDQANPGQFQYIIRMGGCELLGGKILPRQLTQKELKEQEEAAAKKKGPKKEAKKEEVSKEEEERLKKLRQEEEAAEIKRQQEWGQLSEQEKAYRTAEDKYKATSLRFEHQASLDLQNEQLVLFQQRVANEGGEWLYLYKHHSSFGNEDEVAKIKKAKPKGFNLGDLNPVTIAAWVDLSPLRALGKKDLVVRAKVHQVLEDEKAADVPRPNLEHSYVKLKLEVSAPLGSEEQEANITKDEVIREVPPAPGPLPEVQCVNELKDDISLAIESIAMQYSSAFGKQLNGAEESKMGNAVYSSRKGDVQRRKEQFLYDFNLSGKYKILKERMKKAIVNLCKHKYAARLAGLQSFTGVTAEARDQFYSELHLFLVSTAKETLKDIVFKKTEELLERYVPERETQEKCQQQYLGGLLGLSAPQRVLKANEDYEVIGRVEQVKQNFAALLQSQPRNTAVVMAYIGFALRYPGIESPAKLITILEQSLRVDRDNVPLIELMTTLLICAQVESSCGMAFVFLNHLLRHVPEHSTVYYLLLAVLFQVNPNPALSKKYELLAVRTHLRRKGLLKSQLGKHKEHPQQVPTIRANFNPAVEVSPEVNDELWMQLIHFLNERQVTQLAILVVERLKDRKSDVCTILTAKKLLSSGQVKEALAQLQGKDSYQTLMLQAKIHFDGRNWQDAVKVLLIALKTEKGKQSFELYLRLGHALLKEGNPGNAKAVFTKLLARRQDTPLTFIGLALAELELGNADDALAALKEANYIDPQNYQPWGYSCIAALRLGKYELASQTLREMFSQLRAHSHEDELEDEPSNPRSQLLKDIKKELKEQCERKDLGAGRSALLHNMYAELDSETKES